MQFPRFSSSIAGAAVLLCSCAVLAEPRFRSPEAALQYHVMAGELAALRQMPEVAAEQFLKALELAPTPELAMRAASLALVAGNEALALKAAQRWQTLAPNEADAREAVARLALRGGDRAQTLQQCAELIKGHPGGPEEGFRQVAQLLSQEGGKQEDALAVMDALRAQYAELPGAYYAQSLLALRFGQLDLAERAAREALRLKPDNRDARLLLVGVLVKKGDLAAAERSMSELIASSANPAELHLGYARLLVEAERHDEARRQFEAALSKKPDYAEARYALGLLALEREDFDVAATHLRALLETEGFRMQAMYYLGRIDESRQRWPEALKWYEQVTSTDLAIDAIVRRAAVLSELGRADESRALLAQMREQLPGLATRFYLTEGEILLDAGQGAEALNLYQRALAEEPGNPDLLYGRSLVHERMGNLPLAEADLRAILIDEPDDSRAMNALGYILTVHTQRYDEARRLIARALELSPDDPAVIDSMGWVEFRLGKVEQARTLLEKAFSKAKDAEIAAHLGEVLWTLGDKAQARAIWEEALARDPEHRVLKETVERLSR